jgi:hypothetical protein
MQGVPLGSRDCSVDAAQKGLERMQRAATDIFPNQALVQEDARHAFLPRSASATSVGEKIKGADAQVTEWGFTGTRYLEKCGSQSSALSRASSASASHESGGSLLEQEQSRHQNHLELLERLVLYKHIVCNDK